MRANNFIRSLFILCYTIVPGSLLAQQLVAERLTPSSFSLANTVICTDSNDFSTVQIAASLLKGDLKMVTGKEPVSVHEIGSSVKNIILIGSVERSSFIQQLITRKKLDISAIKGKWEAYRVQTIANPFPGVENALLITGSDRRGTAYGVVELSQQIGVSPWYWWADVPVKKKPVIYINKGVVLSDAPRVKYRGIFINDEAPAFSGWAREKFGGINHRVYEEVFELILRLKGNYLWPAMWGNAFNDDDTLSPVLADQWGIVMGTSHHEPMLRAQQEWKRYGKGPWNYDSNATVLQDFWKKGIQHMGRHESIVTVGMRGDGDKPMTEGTATALLERIVKDQREILEQVTGKPAAETPQLWALYKEVQDYYDKGMRVPDDVTLLLCDDNWGNIRKLPKLNEAPRKGGYGIYYHFDYVGGPRNYKWVNTNPLPRIWEQMHLAYEYNVRQIWIVNVGDIKPMELPISFFLDYAWNPAKIGAEDLQRYTEHWCEEQFGKPYAKEIAEITSKYLKYNGRRKPELLDQNTYSLDHYNEFERVVNDYNSLVKRADKINDLLPAEYHDAYFQLVLHPVKACANLNEMYYNAAMNRDAHFHKWASANQYAARVKELYGNDSLISIQYHHLNNGKWNHMMDQTHIGYTYWQQPAKQKMPNLKYVPEDSVKKPAAPLYSTIGSARRLIPVNAKGNLFYEYSNYVSIEADHFTKAVNTNGITWKILPDLGKTGSAVTAFPVTAVDQKPGSNAPHLEYEFYSYSKGALELGAYFSPTLNFHSSPNGLQYAISIDDEQPEVISLNKEDNYVKLWEGWVANDIIIKTSDHTISGPGKHVLKFWMVSPGVVLQKLVLDFGGASPSYLGPPETKVE